MSLQSIRTCVKFTKEDDRVAVVTESVRPLDEKLSIFSILVTLTNFWESLQWIDLRILKIAASLSVHKEFLFEFSRNLRERKHLYLPHLKMM